MASAVLANALSGVVKGGGSAKAVTDKAKKGAFATAIGASPQVQIVVKLILDVLDGVVSAEINFDLPNGEQTFAFLDNCVTNWNSLATQAIKYISEGHAYAGQGFAIVMFELAEPLPCSSRLALTYWARKGLAQAMGVVGKTAGSSSVNYWETKYKKLLAGEKVEFYAKFNNKGQGIPSSLSTCKLGFGGTSTEQKIGAPKKPTIGFAPGVDIAGLLDFKGADGVSPTEVIELAAKTAPKRPQASPVQRAAIGAGALFLLSRLAG